MNIKLNKRLDELEAKASQDMPIKQGLEPFYSELRNNPVFMDEFYSEG